MTTIHASLDGALPADFELRAEAEARVGRVPFMILRPDRGEGGPPVPIAIVFGPSVPGVGEVLLWDNDERYAVIGVTHRLTSNAESQPYLRSLPMLETRPIEAGNG